MKQLLANSIESIDYTLTSPHGNSATVTSPHKLCHMVTSPHFEKVRGDVGKVGKCVWVRGRKGRCGKRYERRCRKVCWGVGEVRGDVGKGKGNEVREMWGSVGGSVLGSHTLTHFPTPPPFLSPPANTFPYSPHTLCHTPPHTSFLTSQHTSLHLPPHLFPQLPSPPYTPTHFPMHSSTPLPTVSIMWQSYHVTMLPW